MVGLGVSEKQKERSRQVLERSAEIAGYFEHGRNRLVMPAVKEGQPAALPEEKPEPEKGGGNGGGGGSFGELHPFIQGLLQTLSKPESTWSAAARAKWLQTAANIFDLIYKGDGGVTVSAARAERSPRPADQE